MPKCKLIFKSSILKLLIPLNLALLKTIWKHLFIYLENEEWQFNGLIIKVHWMADGGKKRFLKLAFFGNLSYAERQQILILKSSIGQREPRRQAALLDLRATLPPSGAAPSGKPPDYSGLNSPPGKRRGMRWLPAKSSGSQMVLSVRCPWFTIF